MSNAISDKSKLFLKELRNSRQYQELLDEIQELIPPVPSWNDDDVPEDRKLSAWINRSGFTDGSNFVITLLRGK